MAIEQLCSYYWELKGYITRVRVSFRTKKGQNSDIDVACFKPKSKEGILISVKAGGMPEQYPTHNKLSKPYLKWLKEIVKKSFNNEAREGFKEVFGVYPTEAKLYLPGKITEDLKADCKKKIRGLKMPFRIHGLDEIIEGLIVEMNRDIYEKRVRYADPAREFIRWFLRSIKHDSINLLKIDEEIRSIKNKDYRNYIKKIYIADVLANIKKRGIKGSGSSIYVLKALQKVQGNKKDRFFSSNDIWPYAKKEKRNIGWTGYQSALWRLYKFGILEIKKEPKPKNRNRKNEPNKKYRIHPSFLRIIGRELRKL